MKLGERIKAERLKKGLTQNRCAVMAGVSSQRWAWFESDKFANPTLKTLEAISGALGVALSDLQEKN